jgi:hypothetical protein
VCTSAVPAPLSAVEYCTQIVVTYSDGAVVIMGTGVSGSTWYAFNADTVFTPRAAPAT